MEFQITQFGFQMRKLHLLEDRVQSRAKNRGQKGRATSTWIGRPNPNPNGCQLLVQSFLAHPKSQGNLGLQQRPQGEVGRPHSWSPDPTKILNCIGPPQMPSTSNRSVGVMDALGHASNSRPTIKEVTRPYQPSQLPWINCQLTLGINMKHQIMRRWKWRVSQPSRRSADLDPPPTASPLCLQIPPCLFYTINSSSLSKHTTRRSSPLP